MFQAAEFGDIKLVQYLLDKGVDIDGQDEEGDTPLHHAVRSGRNALVTYLLRCQASVFIKNKKGHTVILEAYSNNQGHLATEITRQVVKRNTLKAATQSFCNKKRDPKKELDNFIKECKEHFKKNYLNRGIFSRLMARHNERAKALIQAFGRCTSVKDIRSLIKNQSDLFEKGKSSQAIPAGLLPSRWSAKIKNKPSNVSKSSFYRVLSTIPAQKPLLLLTRNQRQVSSHAQASS